MVREMRRLVYCGAGLWSARDPETRHVPGYDRAFSQLSGWVIHPYRDDRHGKPIYRSLAQMYSLLIGAQLDLARATS